MLIFIYKAVACACYLILSNMHAHRLSSHICRTTKVEILSPVHTSNNHVEATFDFVEALFNFVAKNGNSVEAKFELLRKNRSTCM